MDDRLGGPLAINLLGEELRGHSRFLVVVSRHDVEIHLRRLGRENLHLQRRLSVAIAIAQALRNEWCMRQHMQQREKENEKVYGR